MGKTKIVPYRNPDVRAYPQRDLFYVDKTEYVYHMTHTSGKYFFLSRPRRFGKSLLVSTFHGYFEGRKDLFEGLAIETLETEWKEYPMLHFDMSRGKHQDKYQLEEYQNFMQKDGVNTLEWKEVEVNEGANIQE